MSGPFRKIVTGAIVFLSICVVAVLGYMSAGWRLDDSIYMVIITIFGVGYGEVHPIQSPALRSLTIMVIIFGYASLIYTVGGFMQMLIDGEINKALGARKMNREIERLTNHTIVCGIGRLGTTLATELTAADKSFIVVEKDDARVEEARERGFLVIQGDATEEHVLESAGIERAATLATVLSADAVNVFVTITARAMNSEILIIARGENPQTEKKLLGCGADKVVLPTAIGAKKVAQLIIRPSAESMIERITHESFVQEELGRIGLQFDELNVGPDSPLVDKAIKEIEIRSNHGFLIVGIRHADASTTPNPNPETRLKPGDVVIVLGHDDDIPELAGKFFSTQRQITYRGATL